MCGICGWVDWQGRTEEEVVVEMARRLSHRGPDGQGIWRDSEGVAVLAHRRLKVIDTSCRADQPMIDPSGRVLSYNGEVYSFQEIRRELQDEGFHFRSSGDTEVILRALSHWGERALGRFNGMFAIALWEPEARRLLLVRDRIGIKPLFWSNVSGGVVFASELSALLCHPGVNRQIDQHSVAKWLQLGYLNNTSMLSGVQQLPPGHILEADENGISVRPWYDLLSKRSVNGCTTEGEAIEELEALIRDSVGIRLVSDVPLGCFLSSGVDSTVVTAAARAEGAMPETLSVRFAGGEDETGHAARTAAHLGLKHNIVECAPQEMLSVFGQWTKISGDPLADPSMAPTSLVSEAARRRWTVALSGDGGDELLSGYPRLRLMPRIDPLLRTPRFLRRAIAGVLPPRRWGAKLDAALRAGAGWEAYQALQGVWPLAEVRRLLPRTETVLPWDERLLARLDQEPRWRRYRLLDLLSFLPSRVLAKVDRASMAHSLEVRVPLLDYRIVEFLLGIPPHLATKNLLRSVARNLGAPPLPKKKRGFEVPLGLWLRGPLRDTVANDILGDEAAALGLNREVLKSHWQEHQSGRRDHAERLFAVAVLVRWVRSVQ